MKKIIKIHWNNYKNSDSGKDVIEEFEKITDPNTSLEKLLQLACKFDPEFFKNASANEKKQGIKFLEFLDNEIQDIRAEIDKLGQEGAYIDYKALSCIFFSENEDVEFEDIPQATFKSELGTNLLLSLVLSRYFSEYYIPNFFPLQFIYYVSSV